MDDLMKVYNKYIRACERYIYAWYDFTDMKEYFQFFPSKSDYTSLERIQFIIAEKKYQIATKRLNKAKSKLESVKQNEIKE